MTRSILGILLTIGFAVSSAVSAQEQRGTIQGTVRDASGAVLPGAMIQISSLALIGGSTTTSGPQGEYSFRGLPPGTYEVTAELQGFSASKVENVLITLGKTLRVDLALGVEAVQETVTVSGASPLIDTTASAVSASLQRKEFDVLPKGRDFTSIAALAPGANDESKLGGISIDGASAAENVYYIDGMDVSNLQRGISAKRMALDLVDEVQVKSSGYNAEYGGALGGVINAVTRSGANRYSGEVNFYARGSAFTATPNPVLRLGLIDSNTAETVTYAEDSSTILEPGFMLGGYLKRDRLWFYGSYFPEVSNVERTVTFRTTGQSGTYEQRERTHFALGKITAQISKKMRGNISYNVAPARQEGRLPNIDGTSAPDFPFSSLGSTRENTVVSGNIDYVATNKLYVNMRAGYFAYDLHDEGVPNEIRYSFGDSNLLLAGIPDSLRRPTGWSNIPTNSGTTKDLQSRTSWDVDTTYQAAFAGRHTFKAGLQFTRLANDLESGALQNNISLFWDRAYTARSTGLRYQGPYGYYSYLQSVALGDVHSDNLALFLQDSWQLKNLTLNMGVRAEREDVPSYLPEDLGFAKTAIHFNFGDKIAPRLGATYDVRGDAKWKLYGGYGKFYDVMKLELPRGLFGASRQLTYFRTLDTFDWPSIGLNNNFPGSFIEVVNGRPSAIERDWVDPDIKPVQSEEYSLGIEHELSTRTSFGVRYIRKRLIRTIEDTGFVGPTGSTEYVIGNPGFGQTVEILRRSRNLGGFPADVEVPKLPKARRDYDAVEFRLTKRFANRWFANLGYTWSRLFGNYTGLVAADELSNAGVGRLSPNASSAYDQAYNVHDGETGKPLNRHLPTDRPHQIKGQLAYMLRWGTTLGGNLYVSSGTPVLRSFFKTNDIFYGGDLSEGRTPTYSQFDLNMQHELRLQGSRRLQLAFNVLNLFDQRTVTAIYFRVNRDTISFTDVEFFAGQLRVEDKIRQLNIRREPRFLKPFAWQAPREARVSVRLVF